MIKKLLKPDELLYNLLGTLCAVFALKGFMIPNHFIDGGVTGISILLQETLHLNIVLLLCILNIPFLILGYLKIGKLFAIKSLLSIGLLSILLHFMTIPVFTEDKILIAIFGGALIGLGIGLIIRSGGVIDGLEVIAAYTTKKWGITTSEIILFVNAILMFGAAFSFGIETAMYSILTYFTAMKMTDYVVDGFEEYTGLTIVSSEHEKLKEVIVQKFKKGMTIFNGERGHLPGIPSIHQKCDIILTIVTRLEVPAIRNAVTAIDPNAFFYLHKVKEVGGGIIKRTHNH